MQNVADHDEQPVDELLVMECQGGNAKAMDLLVVRWQKHLWHYAYRLTGSAEAAWDVTQETWLAIVRGISRLSDPARFKSWAYRIATNKARDWIAGAVEARAVPAKLTSKRPEEDGPSRNETSDELQRVMGRLPQEGRAVLTLYYLEGFAVADIAAILHVPQGTVKSRLHNARNELKILWLQESA